MASACKRDRSKKDDGVSISFKKEGIASLKKSKTDSSYATFDIEFARTEYETQTGLMYRDSLKSKHGMLFIFEESSPRSFYMRNTRIPLDIIFLSEQQLVVSYQKNATPFDNTSLPSVQPAKYVLEINAGLIDQLNIEVGDLLEFESFE